MNIEAYLCLSKEQRENYFDNFTINSALSYFGGKKEIGSYLMAIILNMACKIHKDKGKKPDFFIDAFTGGGKIALSVPEDFFGTIVMNDLDYGVYNYYMACKNAPQELIDLIHILSTSINEHTIKMFAYNRNNRNNSNPFIHSLIEAIKSKSNNKIDRIYLTNTRIEPLLSAAMTYWVVNASITKSTEPINYSYALKYDDNGRELHNEGSRIAYEDDLASKRIMKVHRMLKNRNIIIENMDYRELIKKYNGLAYKDINNKKHDAIEDNKKKSKLWYFDPPYHEMTLIVSGTAPYACSFNRDMTHEMTKILAGKSKGYGDIEYFIKSDYRIRDFAIQDSDLDNYKTDFDLLEENCERSNCFKKDREKTIYYVEYVGAFNKMNGKLGKEYVWCRGNYDGKTIVNKENEFVTV